MDTQTATGSMRADILVIGFGAGGKAVAAAMARRGKRVVIVERSDRMYGGTCPNVGCIPSKGLVHHSRQRRPTDAAQEWYERSVRKVQAVRETMRSGSFEALNGADNISVITGPATFVDPHTVSVDVDGDRLSISADTIVINTGSEPIIPDIPGLRASAHTTDSAGLMENPTLPGRLAIIGGGYLGIEFASIYRQFGSEVTVLDSAPGLLPREDDDVAAAAVAILTGEGIEIVTGAQVTEVRDTDTGATVTYRRDGRQHTIEVDTILAALGRAPATRGLGLDAAGVRSAARGAAEVDEQLRTSQPHIYALGDVNGGPQFTYIAYDDSQIVLDHLVGEGRRAVPDRVAVPHTVFMTPPLATVGLSETDARAAGHRVKVASRPVAEISRMPRTRAVEETRGFMKFVIDAESDQILGAALLCIDAQELINTVALAIRHGITATDLRDGIYSHPSSTEAFNTLLATAVPVGA
ncbi:FAD-dependent oxidoreductase [Micromonospora sp. URMC 105]|uniref:FAD-dependent oxidoreductase n=1 Tax=Micromonospora sp. URMC 105 TaxID=3423413 RepID=UPI003F1C64B8